MLDWELFEFDGVALECVPLAHNEVAVWQDTNIVAVVKNRFCACERLEFSLGVNRFCSSRSANDFIFGVEDDHKTAGVVGEFIELGIFGPTNARVDLSSIENRSANHCPGDVNGFQIMPVQREAAETVVLS